MSKTLRDTILVVDDEKSIRDAIFLLLQDEYNVVTAETGRAAIETVKNKNIDLVLLDMRLPEIDGIAVLKTIKEIDDSIEVIMITAVVAVRSAVAAIKEGAYDYITKPFDIDALKSLVKNPIEKRRLQKENRYLKSVVEARYEFEKIIGKSPPMEAVFELIHAIAQNSNSTVLITGESGTGKELVARAIHNRSPRKTGLFVAVNCAALPENLIESELFGHEKGSFTSAFEKRIGKFELAAGGTLFLDEISTLPLSLQSKLLRALQEKEIERVGGSKLIPIDVRIIAATNQNLKMLAERGTFREDLFFRLNVIPVNLPPLRERKEDISILVNHFLNVFNQALNKSVLKFSDEALAQLIQYPWPGNVRELENLVERLVVLSKEDIIPAQKLPAEIYPAENTSQADHYTLSLKKATQEFEADFIKKILAKAEGNKSKAAKMLGVHRNTLLSIEKRIKKTGAKS